MLSKRKILSGKLLSRGIIALASLAILTGCASHVQHSESGYKKPKLATTQVSKPVTVKPATSAYSISKQNARRAVAQAYAEPSARCRRLLGQAGINATILRSPSLTSEVDDEKSLDVGIGYDLVDLKRANLTEELAVAQCGRQAAIQRLSYLLVTAGSAISHAGKLASAHTIEANLDEMARIGDDIDLRVGHGHVTVQQAALLRNHLSQLQSRQAQDLAEASKLKVAEDLFARDFRDLDGVILEAEAHIHHLQKSMRTANAITSRISANYGRTFSSDTASVAGGSGQDDGDLSAKIELSVRLGAFSARRHAYEDVVAEAREAEYFEPETGAFWRTKEIAQANQRARAALERQKRSVESAIAYSQKSFSKKAALINPNAVGNELRARIEMIALKADLAALKATLSRTRNLHKHLSLR